MAEGIAVMVVRSWDEEEIAALYKAGGWWKDEYKTEDLRNLIQGSFAFAVAIDTKTGRLERCQAARHPAAQQRSSP